MVLGGFLFAGDPLASAVRPLAALLLVLVVAKCILELRASKSAANASFPLGPWTVAVGLLGLAFLVRGLAPLLATGPDAFGARAGAGIAALGLGGLWLGFTSAGVAWPLLRRLLPAATTALGLALIASRLAGGSGLFGNTGYDLQVLLPGAVIGLSLWLREPRAWFGLGAFLVTLGFGLQAPVVGGVLALGLFAGLGLLTSARDDDRRPGQLGRASVLLAVAALAGLWFWLPTSGSETPPASTSEAALTSESPTTHQAGDELAGVGVRKRIWISLTALPSAAGWPFGTGQFQAAYPPFRDPAELAITTGNHTIEAVTEVEHPHNDALLLFAENGWITAGVFLVALLLFVLGGLRRLSAPRPPVEPALAAGALALVVAGAFHAPLFTNPIAALLGGLLLGASSGIQVPSRPPWSRSLCWITCVPILLALALALRWSPLSLDATNPELASVAAARSVTGQGRVPFELVAARARSAADTEDRAAWWALALELHPHSIEALTGAARAAVQSGDLQSTRSFWHAARELDPAYPVVLRNLERLGADLVLAGHLEPGLAELAPRLRRSGLGYEGAWPTPTALETQATREKDPFDRALRCASAWLHGRQLFEAGSTSAALFELRRAAVLAGHGERPPAVLGVEIAVLASLQGDVQAARASLTELLAGSDREATTERLLAELPSPLENAARILVRGISWDE